MSDASWESWTCEKCGQADHERGRLTCSNCKRPSPAHAKGMETAGRGCRRFLLAVIAIPLLGASIYYAYDAYSHQKVQARWTVQGHEWRRTIATEVNGTWTDELWCTNMREQFPYVVASEVSQRVHGSRQVKTGETCTGNSTHRGDANRICTDVFGTEPVMDDWCVFTWTGHKAMRTTVSEGSSTSPPPTWPSLVLAVGEREGQRMEHYVVTLRHGERERSCDVPEDRWSDMSIGSVWTAEQRRGSDSMDCSSLER